MAPTDLARQGLAILAEQGSFLLLRGERGCAIVERRNGRLYPMRDGTREAASDSVEDVLSPEDWREEAEAQRLFRELCTRGDRLAQTLR
jgi:hypothetical protein